MPVYFVYRCSYGSPSEKFVRRFEYDTVLDWAKAVWKLHDTHEDAKRYAEKLFGGTAVNAHCTLFLNQPEYSLQTCPQSMTEVHLWFTNLYCEEEDHGPHHIQVLTELDDNQRAIYVFDDHFRKKKPGKTDFLLLDGWELPAGESPKKPPKLPKVEPKDNAGGEGTVYLTCGFVDCKYNLEDVGPPERIDGLRLPDLARYALLHPDPDELAFPLNKVRLGLDEVLKKPKGEDKGFLVAIRDQPDELTNWGAYSDWLQDRDLPPAGIHLLDRALRTDMCTFDDRYRNPKLDHFKATPHMVQACKHDWAAKKKRSNEPTADDLFVQFIFFDDRWAAAHPTLASGILTFASRWDVLT